MELKSKVFISYAREDADSAERLYRDLVKSGLEPWFDKKSLLPGQRWKTEIKKAIQESDYFLALLSSHSVSKRGYVQKEIREALDLLDEFTDEDIFFIPARLDKCKPSHEKINELNWVDLFPNYEDGLTNILRVFNADPVDVTTLAPLNLNFDCFDGIQIEVEIISPIDSSQRCKVHALIDTGARISVLPAKILSHFENLPYKYLKVRSFTGELQALKSTSVHFCFGSMTVPDVETIFIDQDRAILGRNILKDTVVLLDGPQEIAKIWFKKQQ